MQTYVIEQMVERGKKLQQWATSYMESMSGSLDLPSDICEWVSPAKLVSWVQEEVSKLNGSATPGALPTRLLAVLSFAYSRGIFDSEEILRLCQSNVDFQKLCDDVNITLEALLSVRHKDRGLLVTLTVRLLTRAVVEHCEVPGSSLPPDLKRRLHENAVDRLDTARHMDRGEEI